MAGLGAGMSQISQAAGDQTDSNYMRLARATIYNNLITVGRVIIKLFELKSRAGAREKSWMGAG